MFTGIAGEKARNRRVLPRVGLVFLRGVTALSKTRRNNRGVSLRPLLQGGTTMRLLVIALTALLLAGCAVVPLTPYMYAPGPPPRGIYGHPVHPHHQVWRPYGRW